MPKSGYGYGPRIFLQDHIRVEKIKIVSLVPNIYGVSLADVNKQFRLRESLFLAQCRSVYIQFWGNGLEAHHEKGLIDVVKSQHFFFNVIKLKKGNNLFHCNWASLYLVM